MKTKISEKEEAVLGAAQAALAVIKGKPDAVLALSAGEDELAVYRTLSRLARKEGVSLKKLRLFAACELEGLADGDARSARLRLRDSLFADSADESPLVAAPDSTDCAGYDRAIAEAGGLDLAILGLGANSRVAFNEPATQYDTYTHVQKLTKTTRTALAPLFGSEEEAPARGVTLGFQNLCAAREILVIACGEEKKRAVFHMLYGRDDSIYPAAFLQLPANVTLFADALAAADL